MNQGKVLASQAFGDKASQLQAEQGLQEETVPVRRKQTWLVTLGGADRRRVTIQVDAASVDVVDGSLVFLDDGLVCHVQGPGTWRSCAIKGTADLGRNRVKVVGNVNVRQLEDVL